MGEWWAVACQYRLIERCTAGAMKLLARYINFSHVRVNSARMLLRSASSQGQVSICQKDYQYVQIMIKTIIDGSRSWMDKRLEWASMDHQRYVVLYVRLLNNNLVTVMHDRYTGSLYRQQRQRHAPCCILGMSDNGASTLFSFASWVIYVPIGCRHQFLWYCQPSLGKTKATCSLPHPKNERQWSVNNFQVRILRNLCSDWL